MNKDRVLSCWSWLQECGGAFPIQWCGGDTNNFTLLAFILLHHHAQPEDGLAEAASAPRFRPDRYLKCHVICGNQTVFQYLLLSARALS